MPLKLSLKPGEKFVLNGAVVQNGDRRFFRNLRRA
jgi:flagellar protein FlbT